MNFLSGIFSAIAEYFGWRRQRDAALNAPDVKAAAKGANEARADGQIDQAIEERNLDELRKQSAE